MKVEVTKFGICNEIYKGRTVFEAMEHAAKVGYHGIELAPFTLTNDVLSFPEKKQRAIAKCADKNSIKIIGLHWLFVKPEGLHMISPDAKIRKKTQDVFRKLIEITTNTGGKILTLGSPAQRSFPENENPEIAVKRTVEFFHALIPELEANNLIVGLEPLELEFTNFITRTTEACKIVDLIGSESIGVTLDAHFLRWECRTYGTNVLDMFELAGSRLVHLHIQDNNNGAPGTGTADFTEYIEAVKHIRWREYVSVETFGVEKEGEEEQVAASSISFLKNHFT